MHNNCEVFILCGGEGKRLRSMISEIPKPMAPIGERPFLDYLVKDIEKQGFKNFCFLSGYKSEIIEEYFKKHFAHLNLRFSVEDTPLGTGGAILKAVNSATLNQFLVVNGDTFFNIDLGSFISSWRPGTLKLALRKVSDTSRYGKVEINQDNRITSFVEKSSAAGAGLINGGIYALEKGLFSPSAIEGEFISLENDIFPKVMLEEKIYSQVFDDDFIDIGIPEDYIRAKVLIEEWAKKPR